MHSPSLAKPLHPPSGRLATPVVMGAPFDGTEEKDKTEAHTNLDLEASKLDRKASGLRKQ
jgi:hypothetical protein